MKGYAYLDLDNNLVYKTFEYIQEENPGFFTQNRHLIVKHWLFDTDNLDSMRQVLRQVGDLKTPVTSVEMFLRSIGFDITKLKNASKV